MAWYSPWSTWGDAAVGVTGDCTYWKEVGASYWERSWKWGATYWPPYTGVPTSGMCPASGEAASDVTALGPVGGGVVFDMIKHLSGWSAVDPGDD